MKRSLFLFTVITLLCGCVEAPSMFEKDEGLVPLKPKGSYGVEFTLEEGNAILDISCELPENHCVALDVMTAENKEKRSQNQSYSSMITLQWWQEDNSIRRHIKYSGVYWVLFTNLNDTETVIRYQVSLSR